MGDKLEVEANFFFSYHAFMEKSSIPRFFSTVRGNKLHFISLGCPRNLVDTEVMLGIVLKAGYELTPSLEEADHIVINTCGFLEASRFESLKTIEETTRLKKKNSRVIVVGCMVQTHQEKIKKKFPHIDYFLGSGDIQAILQALKEKEKGSIVTEAKSFLEIGEVPRQISTPPHYAYLKIAEGCRKRCAYCIIPTIKGGLKSKPIEQVVMEFRALRKQGVKEIILIAQDLGDFGKDQGYKRSFGLLSLIKEILKEKGNFWLRLLYLYPDEITKELIALIKSDSRICPYLDMPIQHINPEILKTMRRTTSKEQIIEIIKQLRDEIPEISIRTSLIVGFPGETEKQFEELLHFVQTFPLDHVGIFKYSREPGSVAASLPHQVLEKVKTKRLNRLAKVQQKMVKKQLSKKIGKKIDVIVEGYHRESKLLMCGRHQGQCPEIDGQVLLNDHRKVNSFHERYKVEITGIALYDLVGTVLG